MKQDDITISDICSGHFCFRKHNRTVRHTSQHRKNTLIYTLIRAEYLFSRWQTGLICDRLFNSQQGTFICTVRRCDGMHGFARYGWYSILQGSSRSHPKNYHGTAVEVVSSNVLGYHMLLCRTASSSPRCQNINHHPGHR